MDIEWAKDGDSGEIFIVQARPETVEARRPADVMKRFMLEERRAAWHRSRTTARGAAKERRARWARNPNLNDIDTES